MRRTRNYAAFGLVLSLGAPVGWLILRTTLFELDGGSLSSELASHSWLYGYMLVATGLVFTAFGAATGRLADALTALNLRLADLAVTDELTGLHNARYFRRRLHEEVARARRHGASLALIVGDLDHFKRVNDEHGHAVGDRVLMAVGETVRRTVRGVDIACRIGGEEFGILCPNTELEEARQVAERLRAAIAELVIDTGAQVISITASLGVATLNRDSAESDLFASADAGMYAAKKDGRNRVVSAEDAKRLPAPGRTAQILRDCVGKPAVIAGMVIA